MADAPAYRLVRLATGVNSVHALAEGETFHPVIGPVAEAEALYVRQTDLRRRLATTPGEFVVWDVGLGAAANVLTVIRAVMDIPARLRIVSFDRTLEPLRFGLANAAALGYVAGFETELRDLLNGGAVRWGRGLAGGDWEVHVADFPALVASPAAGALPRPHLIMFDAFSPKRNPAMWTLPLFTRVYRLLDPGRPCVLPTYSRSTLLRVSLLLAGFYVGKGHATGEKEETTIAANDPTLVPAPLDRRWLWRARRSTSAEPLREDVYRQAPIAADTWEQLLAHPQFR